MQSRTIGVIGVGYVGLVTAACLADLGHEVVCRDIDPERVAMLERGEVPIHEPGLDQLLRRNRARMRFTLDMDELFAAASIAFVCVDTPPTASGDADLSRVERVIDSIPDGSSATLVMKSTVPVGTGKRIRAALDRRGLADVRYASNPEFLREGSAIADFMQPDRVVVGADDPAVAAQVASLYEPLDTEVMTVDTASAEMVKLAANAFLATKISFINEIANVCEVVGADVAVVARGMGLDRRIGRAFLGAGIGYGGSCFPKDVSALVRTAREAKTPLSLVEQVSRVNDERKIAMGHRIEAAAGGSVRGKTIAVLGVTFKPNTDDMRDAASLEIIPALIEQGAKVAAYDPEGMEEARKLLSGVDFKSSAYEAAAGADVLVILTEWDQFRALDLNRLKAIMAAPRIVDLRNIYKPDEMKRDGFAYASIGRP